jgi:hypothetical protein
VPPLDPAREWLAAGITGLARGREWDAVVTLAAGGEPGDEVAFVALPDGTFVVESVPALDPAPFADALGRSIAAPYRALAVRRPELWAVGAVAIEVATLQPDPGADELELTWTGSERALVADSLPADPSRAAALARIAESRVRGAYAAQAHRVRGEAWEISVRAL